MLSNWPFKPVQKSVNFITNRRETSGADQIILFFFFLAEQTYQSPNFLHVYNPNIPLGKQYATEFIQFVLI